MAAGDIKPVLALGGLAFVAYALGGGQGQSARGRRTHLVVGEKVKYSREGLVIRPERGHLRGLIRKVHPDGYTVDWTYYDEIITTREKDMALVSAASKTLWWPGDHYEGKTPPGHSARGRRDMWGAMQARDKAIQAAINRFPATFGLSHNRGTLYRVSPRIWDHQWNLDKDQIAWLLTEAWVPAGTFKKGEPGHWVDAMKGTPDQLLSIVIEAPKGHSARGRRSIRLETRVAANCHVEGSKPGWKTTGYGFTQDSPSGKWQSRGSMQAFVELWHPNTSRMMDFPVTRSWLKRHPPGTPCKDFRAPKGRSARGRRAKPLSIGEGGSTWKAKERQRRLEQAARTASAKTCPPGHKKVRVAPFRRKDGSVVGAQTRCVKKGRSARGRRARHADGGKAPRTWKQLNKWLLKNGYGYEIVVTRMSEMPAYYGGWHRYVDAVEGHPQPFGETDFWYSSSVYALSPSVKTYDEWVEAIKDLSQGEGGNIWWS